MPFEFTKLELPEVFLIKPRVFGDDRGFFLETYKESDFIEAGIKDKFIQENHSKSSKNVLRGLHYQLPPKAQGKLVRCVRGKVFDVAVDIRKSSGNFGKWVGVELSEENKHMIYIPPGFAHGFVTLTDNVEITYKCTDLYSPENEREIIWNDPDININWPVTDVTLSEKDAKGVLLKSAEVFK